MEGVVFGLFQFAVFIFAVMIHEISHGLVAERLGDPTARLAGRLTLNPLRHLDPFGSFMLPLTLYILTGGAFVFGWAKPVPYNPLLLKDPKTGAGKIAAAGPVSNLLVAAIFGMLFRLLPLIGISYGSPLAAFFIIIIYVNVLLAVFNLVLLPPLDGSGVLFALLPATSGGYAIRGFLERYGLILLLFFLFFGFNLIIPVVRALVGLLAGRGAVS